MIYVHILKPQIRLINNINGMAAVCIQAVNALKCRKRSSLLMGKSQNSSSQTAVNFSARSDKQPPHLSICCLRIIWTTRCHQTGHHQTRDYCQEGHPQQEVQEATDEASGFVRQHCIKSQTPAPTPGSQPNLMVPVGSISVSF